MNPTVLALVLAGLAAPVPAFDEGPIVTRVDERTELQHALDNACRQFSHDDPSLEADRCRRDFFRAHEEAIWRLNLNPHRTQAGPSS